MRLGATDRKQIERIRIKFQELDIKKNNVLDYDELCQGGYLIQAKSNPHFLRAKSETELLHVSPDTASPFHFENEDQGISLPRRRLSVNTFPIPEEDDEQTIREEVQEEIQRMQRARSASIAKFEPDLLVFDEERTPLPPTPEDDSPRFP
jgi:hypothetical protein